MRDSNVATELQMELDKKLVRRGHTEQTESGRALRASITFEMAEQRLASHDDLFWSDDRQEFVHVPESTAHGDR